MISVLLQGGPVAFVLIALSIVGTFVVVQKVLLCRAVRTKTRDLVSLKQHVASEGVDAAARLMAQRGDLLSSTMATVLSALNERGSQDISGIVDSVLAKLDAKLDQHLPLLSSIITVAPILGLLGTVLGLMDVFNVISGGGLGDASMLSAGIAEALLTTVLGLMVAIPFIFAYQLLSSLIDKRQDQLERVLTQLCEYSAPYCSVATES